MPFRRVVFALVVTSLLTATGLSQQVHKTLAIRSGKISGAVDTSGVASYLGIPYALPPFGDLRWKPPQPAGSWKGTLKADHFGANCTQPPVTSFLPWTEEFMFLGPVSEDCLFVNVWTGAKTGAKQAVMVFLHGGGFGGGSGSVPVYDGAALAKKGVIVVNLNYRVGAFGFLVHPELTKESPHHASGNYGLLDQIAALQWVNQNISAFGGDPSKVTIFGQSAGAMSVIDLMRSPLAQGLFARGIVQSDPTLFMRGSDPLLGSSDLTEREQQGLKYAEMIGAHSLAELRALPAGEFIKGSPFPTPGEKSQIYRGGPVIDGWVLTPDIPAQQVPVIAGFVAGDVNMADGFAPPVPPTIANSESAAKKDFGEMSAAFLKLYPAQHDADVPAAKTMSREDRSRVGLGLWATDQRRRSPSVYTYFFDRAIPWPAHPEFGAFHTAEVPYIFETNKVLDRPWEPVDFKLADLMSSYWTNFAKSGDPNSSGLPKWPIYKPEDHTTMQLGERSGAMPQAGAPQLQFFLDYYIKQ